MSANFKFSLSDGFIVGDDGLPIGQRKNGIFSEPYVHGESYVFHLFFLEHY